MICYFLIWCMGIPLAIGYHECHFYNSMESCTKSMEKDKPCVWCTSSAVPSVCYNAEEAKLLPPGIFHCNQTIETPTNHRCHFYNNKDSCIKNAEADEPCYWCESAAVPSTCYNESEAKQLPAGVFTCHKETQEPKCYEYTDEHICNGAKSGGMTCVWYRAFNVLNMCLDSDSAVKLPSNVFKCDKPNTAVHHACHFYNNKDSCVSNAEEGKQCYWCQSAAVPSTCYNAEEASKLPPGVFTCTKKEKSPLVYDPFVLEPSNHGCHFYNNKAACVANTESDEKCYWCQSSAVPSVCYNQTEVQKLPSGVFTCVTDVVDHEVFELNRQIEIDELAVLFDAWMHVHQKQYTSVFERLIRWNNFQESSKMVIEHNMKADRSFTMELNQFADLTWEEFKQDYLMADQDCSATSGTYLFDSVSTPSRRDWREAGIVSPIKNQGKCGSCWTFSTTGCLESHHTLKTNKMVLLSEQNLIDCAGAFDNHGCDGGLPSHAFEYIKFNHGIDTEHSYPYHAKLEQCHFNPTTIGALVRNVVNITFQNETELEMAVGTVGPVSIAYQVSKDFRLYKKGIYDSTQCKSGKRDVNHAVLAVGYDTSSDKKDYWIVKNSWGMRWGMDGYFHIVRHKNMCGLSDCASYPEV